MQVSKLKISADASGKLKMLKSRSGLTPNLLCRMAMMLSFEAGPLKQNLTNLEDGQEFNAYTLFGPYQSIYLDMLRFVEGERHGENISNEVLIEKLIHHIDRGVRQLSVRIKNPADAAMLLAGEAGM